LDVVTIDDVQYQHVGWIMDHNTMQYNCIWWCPLS